MLKKAKEVSELALQVKAIAFDVDGVLTPDTEYLLPGGGIAKARSHNDGQGISLLRAIGIRVVFITSESENSPGCEFIKQLVHKWNNLPSSRRPDNPHGWPEVCLFMGGTDPNQDKGDILRLWLIEQHLLPRDCAVMGDDLVDVPMFRLAGFKIAPAQAEVVVRDMVDWITPRSGGQGAVRDLANLILAARNISQLTLPVK